MVSWTESPRRDIWIMCEAFLPFYWRTFLWLLYTSPLCLPNSYHHSLLLLFNPPPSISFLLPSQTLPPPLFLLFPPLPSLFPLPSSLPFLPPPLSAPQTSHSHPSFPILPSTLPNSPPPPPLLSSNPPAKTNLRAFFEKLIGQGFFRFKRIF